MITNLIHLGDKVDIQVIKQMDGDLVANSSVQSYKSQVNDISEDGSIEIAMPIIGGKVILLPLGTRYDFVFYTDSGLFYSVGQIKERYKRDNIFVLIIELHSPLKKIQRREYYRFPCLMNVQYYLLEQKDAEKKSGEEIFDDLRDKNMLKDYKQSMIMDLSGGGARLVGEEKLEDDRYILLLLNLCNEYVNKQYYILSHVISSTKMTHDIKKYETRIEFMFQDKKLREEIIRYIFQEERKSRKKID